MSWVSKTWKNRSQGAPTTPLDATGMNDLESRITTLADSVATKTERSQIDVSQPPYNLLTITPNPETKIMDALAEAKANRLAGSGPVVVYVPPGEYQDFGAMHLPADQTGSVKQAHFITVPDGCTLLMHQDAKFRLPDNYTRDNLPATATRAAIIGVERPWRTGTAPKSVRILGGQIDANAGNQTYEVNLDNGYSPWMESGIHFGLCVKSAVVGTKIKNFFGDAPGPPGETFAFGMFHCADISYIDCEAEMTVADTSTGFMGGFCDQLSFINCRAYGSGAGHGWAVNRCSGVYLSHCRAYENRHTAFNFEASTGITMSSCIAGGSSVPTILGTIEHFRYPAGERRLGLTPASSGRGIKIMGCQDVSIDASNQVSNTYVGIYVSDFTALVDQPIVPSGVHVSAQVRGCPVPFENDSDYAPCKIAVTADITEGSKILSDVNVTSGSIYPRAGMKVVTSKIPYSTTIREVLSGSGTGPYELELTDAALSSGADELFYIYADVVYDGAAGDDPQFNRRVKSRAPNTEYEALDGASGARFWAKGVTTAAFRWHRDGVNTADLQIGANGNVSTPNDMRARDGSAQQVRLGVASGDRAAILFGQSSDAEIARNAANQLFCNSEFKILRGGSGNTTFSTYVNGDSQGSRFAVTAGGGMSWGSGSGAHDTTLYRNAADQLKTDDKFLATGGIGVGNSAAASTPGTVTRKMEVFDASGASLGFVPIYDAIT